MTINIPYKFLIPWYIQTFYLIFFATYIILLILF